ncbi:hypothetical protein TNCV_3846351 [Trichonephila clavipes]|nr:hypothetical protein TNCV_3846351 [Trichonephila clavipes]
MEAEQTFQLYLVKYQGSDLGDYITFMMYLRLFLNTSKPKEVITIQDIYAVNIIELIRVLPDHEPHDVPWYEYFRISNLPTCIMITWSKSRQRERCLSQVIWNVHVKPKLYSFAYKDWRRHGPQNVTSWTELAQAVMDGCYGQILPDAVFQVPDSCAICLSPMH